MAKKRARPGIRKSRGNSGSQSVSRAESALRDLDRRDREKSWELVVAGEALKNERERLLYVLDQLPSFACLLTPDHTIRFANRSFRNLFGDAEGRPCFAVIRGRVEPCEDCHLQRVIRDQRAVEFEFRVPTGKVFRVLQYALEEPDGTLRVLELGFDITERRKAESALELERNKLKNILDAMPDGVYIVSRENEIIYTNPALVMEFGPVNGRKCYDYFDGRSKPCRQCTFPRILGGESVRTEWHSRRTNRTYDLFGTPIRNYDGTVAKLEILQNITERKHMLDRIRRSEDRFRTLVETMSEGLGTTDLHRRITYVNDRMCELLGFRAEELIGRRLDVFLDAGSRKIVKEQINLHKKGSYAPYELIWNRKDGSKILTIVSPKPILGAGGGLEGNFAVVTDITERRRSEEALKESERQLRFLSEQLLQAQETERGRISRELHDELGQALSILKLRIGLIRKQLRGDQDSILEDCDDTLQYLNQVIEDVRRLARDLSPTILQDLGLTTALQRLLRQFARLSGVRISSRIARIDGLLSRDGELALYRIFQEALNNVRKHARARNVSVSIKRMKDHVHCVVKDDGRGFQTGRIMPAAPTERGMGLAIVHERVRILGGELEVQSRTARGTQIRFRLPVNLEGKR
jgi:PAS domain S-box-containing protein